MARSYFNSTHRKNYKFSLLLSVMFSATPLAAVTDLTPEKTLPLPTGDQWIEHAKEGLQPYWLMESAKGVPEGNFPTFRCDNGEVLDVNNVCPELNLSWISPHFDRDYTRMKSRQIYAYGVIYHLTGNEEALALAKSGVDFLLRNRIDNEHGGFISFVKDGKPGLEWQQRTSQDQAYALVGLAFYYYLTRDPVVEKALIKQQAFIFEQYRNLKNNDLNWVLKDGDEQSAKQRELVAQLDQINGYLLLVTPLLPEKVQKKWRQDLYWLTDQMTKQYYSVEEKRYYGAIHHKAMMMQEAKHNDFAHTTKAFWMTYLVGRYFDNTDWETLGEQGMRVTVDRASNTYDFSVAEAYFIEPLKTQWHERKKVSGWKSRPYNPWTSSWEWAELDQSSMTLNMLDGSRITQQSDTQHAFMNAWVDHQYGGVGLNSRSTKAFHWGNGYHQFEHALVGYLSAKQYYKKPAQLYFALPEGYKGVIEPYYYQGDIQIKQSLSKIEQIEGLTKQRISFVHITP